MRLDRIDALIVLLLLVDGPSSAYRLAGYMIEMGVVSVPPSGFKSVERSVLSRLKKLESLGFVSKVDGGYVVTDRVVVDELRLVGRYAGFTLDVGWSLIFDTLNGHYVVFEVDRLLEGVEPDVLEKIFSGTPIYIPLTNNKVEA